MQPRQSREFALRLPAQTPESFARTVQSVVELGPDRIACYSYAHLPHVFKPQTQILEEDLCPPEVKLALLGITVEKLTKAGYVYVGMDHFAVPEDELALALADGSLQRNFQGYSTRAGHDMVGLGMSSIGRVGDSFVQNLKRLDAWQAAARKLVASHGVPTVPGYDGDGQGGAQGNIWKAILAPDQVGSWTATVSFRCTCPV